MKLSQNRNASGRGWLGFVVLSSISLIALSGCEAVDPADVFVKATIFDPQRDHLVDSHRVGNGLVRVFKSRSNGGHYIKDAKRRTHACSGGSASCLILANELLRTDPHIFELHRSDSGHGAEGHSD